MQNIPDLVRRVILRHARGARVIALRATSKAWRDTVDAVFELRHYTLFVSTGSSRDTSSTSRVLMWPVRRHHAGEPMLWLVDGARRDGARCDAGTFPANMPRHVPGSLECRLKAGLHNEPRLSFAVSWGTVSRAFARGATRQLLTVPRRGPRCWTARVLVTPADALRMCVTGFMCCLFVDPAPRA